MQHFYAFVSQVCHCWCPPFCAPRGIYIHLSPRSVTAVRPFALATQHFYSFASQVCHCWCPPFCAGHAAFLCICFPDLSLLVSALFRWPCSISIHLLPRSVSAGVRPFALATRHFYSFASQVCHCWCPPFSAGHAAFLFICFPGLSLLVSALLRSTRHLYSFVSQVCHCCPPFCAGHAALLFICFPGLSLLVSALLRWPCSISMHLLPRSITAGVRPFPLAMQHFYSFASQICQCWCPPFCAGHAAFLFICFPGLSLLASALLRWPCSISIHLSHAINPLACNE